MLVSSFTLSGPLLAQARLASRRGASRARVHPLTGGLAPAAAATS